MSLTSTNTSPSSSTSSCRSYSSPRCFQSPIQLEENFLGRTEQSHNHQLDSNTPSPSLHDRSQLKVDPTLNRLPLTPSGSFSIPAEPHSASAASEFSYWRNLTNAPPLTASAYQTRFNDSSQLPSTTLAPVYGPPPRFNYKKPPETPKRSLTPTVNDNTPFHKIIRPFKLVTEPGYSQSSGLGASFRSISLKPKFQASRIEKPAIPLHYFTIHLLETYHLCNPKFNYKYSLNPRRVLTKPQKGVSNGGIDNEKEDLILHVNDILGESEGRKYLVLDLLGKGTFGQVFKCQNLKTMEYVAVKVIKNNVAYFNQSMMEVTILGFLNNKIDANNENHILRFFDRFTHAQHLCIVFELLSLNLYELIKQNQFRGLRLKLIQSFASQLLIALAAINKAKIIHCDLKPENILLCDMEHSKLKIIDFGSACHESQTIYTYIQSRFYRSPEVLLGLPYTSSIDIWSFGCIMIELYLGLPLFPGNSEFNQLCRIIDMLGYPPFWMLEMGKHTHRFFNSYIDINGQKIYKLKTIEEYAAFTRQPEQHGKEYFSARSIEELVNSNNLTDSDSETRFAFIDFVKGVLNMNPLERWSPRQASLHPFITKKVDQLVMPPDSKRPFVDPFVNLKQHALDNMNTQNMPLPPSYIDLAHMNGNLYANKVDLDQIAYIESQSNSRPRAFTQGQIDIPPSIKKMERYLRPSQRRHDLPPAPDHINTSHLGKH